ncbi:hypothetical protein [Nocardioides okcheonensis]|uniref:hypothetical protein n=1 Tax=Nocardioides okcheonensis TaxID=2894081 RepID=UPI001E515E99|nr:hypothetical protein [Nocardioides okcheonensis]UFN44187.1 hypothetical protein LN652_19400 [Nocardioides okcheonensis]
MSATPLRAQLDCPPPWRHRVAVALDVAGVTVAADAPVGIAVAPGRLVSRTVDDWCVASLPHLLVGVWPWAVDVGPWVAPGVGPCARCVGAAVLDDGSRPHPEATPGALPGAWLAVAAGVVARDLDAWRRDEPPHTWAASWRFDHRPVPEERRWQRHPYCGCAWFDTA